MSLGINRRVLQLLPATGTEACELRARRELDRREKAYVERVTGGVWTTVRGRLVSTLRGDGPTKKAA